MTSSVSSVGSVSYAANLRRRYKLMRDCQMHMVKLLAALGALSFSTLANAQAHLECGSVACGSHSNAAYGGATGINDLNVGGEHVSAPCLGLGFIYGNT